MEPLDPLFGFESIDLIFAAGSRVQRMLDFEAALARAEGRVGVIPKAAAAAIAASCRVGLFDLEALARDTRSAGNLAIPMVKQLTALVGKGDADAVRYVHWGATSQDAMVRHKGRLAELRARVLVLQFGGAAGTLATLGSQGLAVAKALAEELGLDLPALAWHAERDRVAEVGATLGLLTGSLGKIARDISLQMQTEVGEVLEPSRPGRGGSSTMPHKRNPVACAVVLAAAARVPGLTGTMLAAMSQEHERGLGGWHAEWETLPEIARLSAGALHHLVETVAELEIDARRMRQNLEMTRGLIFAEAVAVALAKHMGKPAAHEVVEFAARRAIAENQHLREVLRADAQVTAALKAEEIDELFEPLNYLGVADQLIDRAIGARKGLPPEGQ